MSKIDVAHWLRSRLAAGPVLLKTLLDEAKAAKISEPTLHRHASKLPIVKTRDHTPGGASTWALQGGSLASEAGSLTPAPASLTPAAASLAPAESTGMDSLKVGAISAIVAPAATPATTQAPAAPPAAPAPSAPVEDEELVIIASAPPVPPVLDPTIPAVRMAKDTGKALHIPYWLPAGLLDVAPGKPCVHCASLTRLRYGRIAYICARCSRQLDAGLAPYTPSEAEAHFNPAPPAPKAASPDPAALSA